MRLEEIKFKIKELAEKYHLSMALLFGSQVEGKIHSQSDIDFAYLSEKKLNLMEEAKLICDLMPIFKSEKIDLVNLKKAPPLLLKRIFDNHQILFCRDKKIYYAYKIYAIRKYLEAKPLFRLRAESLEKFLQTHAG